MSEVVTDPAVMAKLPQATWQVQWQWRSWRMVGDPIGTMRYANAKGYFLGPLFVCRPMPWLLGPARSLHPEAFEAAQC